MHLQMGKRAYPYLPNHKLNTLCDHLQLSLDHHKAGSDSRACALLLLNYLEKGLQPEAFLRTYRFADPENDPVLRLQIKRSRPVRAGSFYVCGFWPGIQRKKR